MEADAKGKSSVEVPKIFGKDPHTQFRLSQNTASVPFSDKAKDPGTTNKRRPNE